MKLLNEAQQEQLQQIGTQLKEAREAKTLSTDDIAMKTCIRPIFIKSLEEGRFEELPEAVFVQGFIRRYADAVGLNGIDLSHAFGQVCFPPEAEDTSKKINKIPTIHIPLFVPYAALIALASFGLFYTLNPQKKAESTAQSQVSTAVATQQTTTVSSPKPTTPSTLTLPAAPTSTASTPTSTPTLATSPTPTSTALPTVSPTTSPNAGNLSVSLELKADSWLSIKADGKTIYEGEMKKGQKKTLSGEKQITVRSRNAGAVFVSVNNQEAKPLGNEGQVKTVTYTNEPKPTPTP